MNCDKDHSLIRDIIVNLPIGQGGLGRHKCAGCAYEKGLEDGRNRKMIININAILNNLPESQALPQRHKDPHYSYIEGYFDGMKGK